MFYLFFKRDNLIAPMLSGKKQDEGDSFRAIDGSKLGLAVGAVVAAVAIVLLLRSLG